MATTMPDRRGKAAARGEAQDLQAGFEDEAGYGPPGDSGRTREDDDQDFEARLAAALAAQIGGGRGRALDPRDASAERPDSRSGRAASDRLQLPLEAAEAEAPEAPGARTSGTETADPPELPLSEPDTPGPSRRESAAPQSRLRDPAMSDPFEQALAAELFGGPATAARREEARVVQFAKPAPRPVAGTAPVAAPAPSGESVPERPGERPAPAESADGSVRHAPTIARAPEPAGPGTAADEAAPPAVPAPAPADARPAAPDIEFALDAAIGEIIAGRQGGRSDQPQTAPVVSESEHQVPTHAGAGDTAEDARAQADAGDGGRGEGRAPGALAAADAAETLGPAETGAGREARPPGVTPFGFVKPPARWRTIPVFRFDKAAPKPEPAQPVPSPSPDDPFAPDPLGAPPAGTGGGLPAVQPNRDPATLGSDTLDLVSARSVQAALLSEAADDDGAEAAAIAGAEGVYIEEDETADWPEPERVPSTFTADQSASASRTSRSRRAVLVLGGVIGLMIVGAIGLGGYGAFTADTRSGEPPVIHADAADVRVAPENAAAEPRARRGVAFYEQERAAADEEQLVVPSIPDFEQDMPVDLDESPDEVVLPSRSVRTVVVRPDGTIIRAPLANDVAAGEVAAARPAEATWRNSLSRPQAAAGDRPAEPVADTDAAPAGPVAAFTELASATEPPAPREDETSFDRVPGGEHNVPSRFAPAGNESPAIVESGLPTGPDGAIPSEPAAEPDSTSTGRVVAESTAGADVDGAAEVALQSGETVQEAAPAAVAGPIAIPRRRPAPPPRSAPSEAAPQPVATASASQPVAASPDRQQAATAPAPAAEAVTAAGDAAAAAPAARTANVAAPTVRQRGTINPETGVLRPNQLSPANGGRQPAFADWNPLAVITRRLGGGDGDTLGEAGQPSPEAGASQAGPAALASNSGQAAAAAEESATLRPTGSTTTAEIFPWAVQVSSQRTAQEAQAAYRWLQKHYPEILGDRASIISEVDLEERGKFYRVRVPAASRDEAVDLCSRLTAAGAECFIGRTGNS